MSDAEKTDRTSILLAGAGRAAHRRDEQGARRLLRAVLRHDPNHDEALLGLVYLAEDAHASLRYLAQLLDVHPHHPQARPAVRWARRRIPTSAPPMVAASARRMRRIPRQALVPMYLFGILTALIGLGVVWGLSQSPEPSIQASAPLAALAVAQGPPTEPPPTQVVEVSIPLFTQTAVSTPTPTAPPVPTPTPSSASVPVVGRRQTYNLSCESRSAADLAGFWGVGVGELEYLANLGLSDNPHKGFVGEVTWPPGSLPPYGYGVYAEPVAATLRDYGLDAHPVYDLGVEGLRGELLAGRPVLIWATYGMEPYASMEWASSDGRVSTVVPFMHTFLVTGFDETGFFFLDAYDATVQHYPNEVFLAVWGVLDQMAVTVTGTMP